MMVIVAYLSCGCVAWYAAREYLPQKQERVQFACPRCHKPSSDVVATEERTVEAVTG
jgi:Zn finger protein HypA/HybF involved in hydrogenase expression